MRVEPNPRSITTWQVTSRISFRRSSTVGRRTARTIVAGPGDRAPLPLRRPAPPALHRPAPLRFAGLLLADARQSVLARPDRAGGAGPGRLRSAPLPLSSLVSGIVPGPGH